ncbi:hypothetical protein [Hathewaya massiliensis]|uniref:hypothetical protein n=1 Tax=Hathewaya massiliensis TaxID=1964382 RepID=UPI00163CC085
MKNEVEKIKDKPENKPKDKPKDKHSNKVTNNIKEKIDNVLPKTGVLFDFKFMILIGTLTILGGIGLLLKKK